MTRETELIELLDKDTNAKAPAKELFSSTEWRTTTATLPLMLGRGLDDNAVILDLAKAPHMLLAGCTGSGKSVFMDSCILSLMLRHTPEELKLILVDTKIVELAKYRELPYLQFPIINSTEDTLNALEWLNVEMASRFEALSKAGCQNITELNTQKPGSMPAIVMFFDEIADLMMTSRSQMETLISPLCAKSRAAGIHLVLCTQRPHSQVLTAHLKVNFPTRIAFRTMCKMDSQTILDTDDATNLHGFGDMLVRAASGGELTRVQGCYVKDAEIARIIERLQAMYAGLKPNALPLRQAEHDSLSKRIDEIIRDVLEPKLDELKARILDELSDTLDATLSKYLNKSRFTPLDRLQPIPERKSKVLERMSNHAHNASDAAKNLSEADKKLLLKAVKIVTETRRTTISYLVRCLGIGYNKTASLLETMEQYGIVSPQPSDSPRTVLVDSFEEAVFLLLNQN